MGRERSAFDPGQEHNTPIKAVYICADQPATLTFRLRRGGGPYIPQTPFTARNTRTASSPHPRAISPARREGTGFSRLLAPGRAIGGAEGIGAQLAPCLNMRGGSAMSTTVLPRVGHWGQALAARFRCARAPRRASMPPDMRS